MGDMTATEAAALLRDMEGQEQALGQRLGGLTLMVWAVVSCAIFLAYGLATPLVDGPVAAALALLWLPLVAAGWLITQRLWHEHLVRFGGRDASLLETAAITTAFLVLGGALYFGAGLAGVDWDPAGIMLSVNGLVAVAMSAAVRRHKIRGWSHLVGAGTAMLVGGLMLGMADFPAAGTALAAGAIAGISWFLAGFAIHLQG